MEIEFSSAYSLEPASSITFSSDDEDFDDIYSPSYRRPLFGKKKFDEKIEKHYRLLEVLGRLVK